MNDAANVVTMVQVRAPDATLVATVCGQGQPVVLVNGAFGTARDWRRVVERLAGRYRTVAFDARGRGRSDRSAAYSFAADLRDLTAVLAETTPGSTPILVGWSYGAALAVRYTAENSGAVAGLVLVDGGFPVSMLTDDDKQKARRSFRRMGPVMKLLSVFGRSTAMSPDQAADLTFELDVLAGSLAADYDRIDKPIDFVTGSRRHPGSTDEQCRTMRASLQPLVNRRPNLDVFATVDASHIRILARHPDTVVAAINDVADRAMRND